MRLSSGVLRPPCPSKINSSRTWVALVIEIYQLSVLLVGAQQLIPT